MKKTIKFLIILVILILVSLAIYLIIPGREYTNEDFGIDTYTSNIDFDNDGIDDQTDILEGARKYVATKPIYKSKYYSGGFPDDEYGVCTDVVAQAFLNAGYNLMELIDTDIRLNRSDYNIETVDKNIDFRRVRNLLVYFSEYAKSLTTDRTKIEEWQGGDIVIFKDHIAIVSDKRNKLGIPYIIHNAGQKNYEEDGMWRYSKVVAHFRLN